MKINSSLKNFAFFTLSVAFIISETSGQNIQSSSSIEENNYPDYFSRSNILHKRSPRYSKPLLSRTGNIDLVEEENSEVNTEGPEETQMPTLPLLIQYMMKQRKYGRRYPNPIQVSRRDLLKRSLPAKRSEEASEFQQETNDADRPQGMRDASPEWRQAMMSYINRMRKRESMTSSDFAALDFGDFDDLDANNVVCKVAPYRRCYRMMENGDLRPLRKGQPINILRVY